MSDDLVSRMRSCVTLASAYKLLEEDADEIERLRLDAERYAWLRQNWSRLVTERDDYAERVLRIFLLDWPKTLDPASIDAAIDAARESHE